MDLSISISTRCLKLFISHLDTGYRNERETLSSAVYRIYEKNGRILAQLARAS